MKIPRKYDRKTKRRLSSKMYTLKLKLITILFNHSLLTHNILFHICIMTILRLFLAQEPLDII